MLGVVYPLPALRKSILRDSERSTYGCELVNFAAAQTHSRHVYSDPDRRKPKISPLTNDCSLLWLSGVSVAVSIGAKHRYEALPVKSVSGVTVPARNVNREAVDQPSAGDNRLIANSRTAREIPG